MKKNSLIFVIFLLLIVVLAGCSFKAEAQKPKKEPAEKSVVQPVEKQTVEEEEVINEEQKEVDTSQWIDVNEPAKIPILMYHSISSGNSLRVPKEEFRAHMKWLKDNGYYTLSPEEAYLVLTQNKIPTEKTVWITFDDGYEDNYTEAYPILKEYGLKASIFMIGKLIDKNNHLTTNQMLEMSTNEISIESHTYSHLELNSLTPSQQMEEMKRSKELFDHMLDQETSILCYPVGQYNEETLKLAEETGYKMALTTEPGAASSDQGLYALHRIRISPGMPPNWFGTLVSGTEDGH
ncbi:polysaccharide deacetylase family protein [Heyndrickxia sp. NPDC080065]|uniref:polysaccharide deacetylase family protein n=1 Tax=Heyndrickxia sp. NPDC080065 TaxID=3390568 RepID=UPI003D087F2F